VRAVKELQHSYAQYAQFGLWKEMASLFSNPAEFTNGKEIIQGRTAIGYLLKTLGHGSQGVRTGEFRAHLRITRLDGPR
jgi:alkyl hydroperoxide reductase subunit AhpF